mgnify:CR=1 FL=1
MEEKKKILIIDDEKDVVDLCKDILEGEGFEVDYALTGKEGIKKTLQHDYELILLDIMLPEMDGWEIIEVLRLNEKTKMIPIAMFTAKTEFKNKILGIQQGAIDYITKPFSPEEIIYRVKRILNEA